MSKYTIETYGELNPYLSFEWLLANGLGGYAASSLVGCNTRRYHGLLCASTTPPVGRVMALNRVGELIVLDGKNAETLRLSINQFHQTFFPRGDQYLERFELDETATWVFNVNGVVITKELLVLWQKNAIGIRYTVDSQTAGRSVQLQLLPFVSLRDFHGLRSAAHAHFQVQAQAQSVKVFEGNLAVHVQCDSGLFSEHPDWWYEHTYALETERGQDDREDLFCPGTFTQQFKGKGQVTLWIGMEPTGLLDWNTEVSRREQGRKDAPSTEKKASPIGLAGPAKPSASLSSIPAPQPDESRGVRRFETRGG